MNFQEKTSLVIIYLIFFITLFFSTAHSQVARKGEIIGTGKVIDGDTIKIGKLVVRLVGIDAPELDQFCSTKTGRKFHCGKIAKLKLSSYLKDGELHCQRRGLGALGRQLAECWVISSDMSFKNLNEVMILNGMAFAHTKFSEEYTVLEAIAKRQKVGLWALDFEYPWEFREKQKPYNYNSSKSYLVPKKKSIQCPSSAPYCKNIRSCKKACFLLKCGFTRLDRDRDGIPCENVCRRRCL